MLSSTVRRPTRLLLTVALALFASGCSGQPAESPAAPSPSISPTLPSATAQTAPTSAPGPLTAEELAWLRAITKLHQDIDEVFLVEGSVTVTPAKLRSWAKVMRSCSRQLARLGSPSERLQPVRVLVLKACQEFDKGAACYEAAIPNLYSGSKRVEQKLDCGTNAEGDGSNLLGEAEAKGKEIDRAAG